MAKKKPQHKCDQCPKVFDTSKGLSIHKTRASHWFRPTPPIPPPERKHVNYHDIVVNSLRNWGQNMTEAERKHPDMDQLKLGTLFVIADTLKDILAELRKPRTLK